jgi:hypothetical protein
MRSVGCKAVRVGKRRTTISRDQMDYPADLVKRQFAATHSGWPISHTSRPGLVRLRGFRHRCVLSPCHRVARGSFDAHRPGWMHSSRRCRLASTPGVILIATGAASISRFDNDRLKAAAVETAIGSFSDSYDNGLVPGNPGVIHSERDRDYVRMRIRRTVPFSKAFNDKFSQSPSLFYEAWTS